MKKLFYSLFILATTALTFCSCEDVPAPFDFPSQGGGTPTPTIDPAGSGTQADPYNVAAAIKYTQELEQGEESPTDIYIKGIIATVRESNGEVGYGAQYGNATFTISDDGSNKVTFLVYRALYLGNKKWKQGDTQIKEGDEVIICGKVTNYNGTLETQQNKAFLYSLNGVTAGGGGGDTGVAKGSGTLEDPYNPAGVIAYINSLGADVESTKDVYIKGKVASIDEQYGTQYGNASFDIVEEGAEGTKFKVFRALYLGNKKYTSGDLLKEKDDVVVCGKVVNYRGNTPETVQGKAFLYSLNGKSEGGGGGGGDTTPGTPTGDGSLSNPFNSVAANNLANGLAADTPSSDSYYIKGKIAKIANNGTFNTQYGNASFYISDDGKDENTFYVFRTLYLGNKKWEDGNAQIKVGDEVIIYGKLVNYKGNTPETVQNESYIYSLNGKTEDTGEGGGGGGEQTGAGSYGDPYSVAAAVAAGSGSGVYVKAYIVGYVEGQVLADGAHFTADGCNVKTNLLIADSSSETNVANCIPVQLPSGNVRTGLNLQDNPGNLGKQVLLYGNIEKYFGATGLKSVTYAEIGGSGVGTKP